MSLVFRRWATKKTAGSTKNARDSNPKYLGVKKFGGEVGMAASEELSRESLLELKTIHNGIGDLDMFVQTAAERLAKQSEMIPLFIKRAENTLTRHDALKKELKNTRAQLKKATKNLKEEVKRRQNVEDQLRYAAKKAKSLAKKTKHKSDELQDGSSTDNEALEKLEGRAEHMLNIISTLREELANHQLRRYQRDNDRMNLMEDELRLPPVPQASLCS